MKRLTAAFLDFDGIILESVDVKGWAFGELFKDYPQHRDAIIQYHHAHGGLPRFNKFRYIHEHIIKQPLSEKRFQELCDGYGKLVFDRVVASPFVPGAKEFLDKYYQDLQFFVVTGTPQEEIDDVVKARGLGKYFDGIYGSPKLKNIWTKEVVTEKKLETQKCLWVGDALSDQQAAQESGIAFIGRVVGTSIFKTPPYKTISDLFDLDKIIQSEFDVKKGPDIF